MFITASQGRYSQCSSILWLKFTDALLDLKEREKKINGKITSTYSKDQKVLGAQKYIKLVTTMTSRKCVEIVSTYTNTTTYVKGEDTTQQQQKMKTNYGFSSLTGFRQGVKIQTCYQYIKGVIAKAEHADPADS